MSQTKQENETVILKNDPSFWEKVKGFIENDFRKCMDDREDPTEKTVKIVVIGKTGAGKGSFINAIRGINRKNAGSNAACENNNSNNRAANVTHGVKPGSIEIEKYEYLTNEKDKIYFYDTGGFGDGYTEKYKLENWLEKYQKENKIRFDAIVFLFDSNRFLEAEIKALKDQENKVCLVLYVVNQIDILKERTEDIEEFKEEKEKIKKFWKY